MADLDSLRARVDRHNETFRALEARKDALLARLRAGEADVEEKLRLELAVPDLIRTELQLQAECQAAMAEIDAVYEKLGPAEEAEGWADEIQELLNEAMEQEDDEDFGEDDEKGFAAKARDPARAADNFDAVVSELFELWAQWHALGLELQKVEAEQEKLGEREDQLNEAQSALSDQAQDIDSVVINSWFHGYYDVIEAAGLTPDQWDMDRTASRPVRPEFEDDEKGLAATIAALEHA